MTIFLVSYLQELKKRGSSLLPESYTEVSKWFSKKPQDADKGFNNLFTLNGEIPLADASLIENLEQTMQDYLMNGVHAISPFSNLRTVHPNKLNAAFDQDNALKSLVTTMITAACMEVLNEKGEVKPEIIDKLKIAEYNTGEKKKILRDKLIHSYVDGVLFNSVVGKWLADSQAQKQIQAKIYSVSLMPHIVRSLPGSVPDKDLKKFFEEYAKSNPKLVISTPDGLPTEEYLDKFTDHLVKMYTKDKKLSDKKVVAIKAQIKAAIEKSYPLSFEMLSNSVQLFPASYIEHAIKALAPATIESAIENIRANGMPVVNDFRPTDFTNFVINQLDDHMVSVNSILNDDPVIFPEDEIIPTPGGETIKDLNIPFKEMLRINDEMHDFIKQWIATSLKNILNEQGHFSTETLQRVTEEMYRPNLNKAPEQEFRPGGIFKNFEDIRHALFLEKMEATLQTLLQNNASSLDDAFLLKLKTALIQIQPAEMADIVNMPLLQNQNTVGNLNDTVQKLFRMLTVSPAFAKPEVKAAPAPGKFMSNVSTSIVSALQSLNVTKVADKAEKDVHPKAVPIPASLNKSLMALIVRENHEASKEQTVMQSFVEKLVRLTAAQIFDDHGNVYPTVYQYVKTEVDIIACTSSMKKVLVALIAQSDAARQFVLQGTKAESLEKFINQITNSIGMYSDEAIDTVAGKLKINKNIKKDNFINSMKMSLSLFDTSDLMAEVSKKVKATIVPFQQSSIVELEDAMHDLILDPDSLDENNPHFKKFITSLTLFGFAEVLDAQGHIKLPSDSPSNTQKDKAVFLAAYLRKVLITMALGWISSDKYQKSLAASGTQNFKLERMIAAIEVALDKGLDKETLLALNGFPLYDSKDVEKFMIPLTISPHKNSDLFEMGADMVRKDATRANGSNNPELSSYYNIESLGQDYKDSMEYAISQLPGASELFPAKPANQSLKAVIKEARRKVTMISESRDSTNQFLEEMKGPLQSLHENYAASEKTLEGIAKLNKESGKMFPESAVILKKMRETNSELIVGVSQVNIEHRTVLRLHDELKRNVFTYQKSTLDMLKEKLEAAKLTLKSSVDKLEPSARVVTDEANQWLTHANNLKEIQGLNVTVDAYLDKLAIDIQRKKRIVEFARKSYIDRKDIIISLKSKQFVWDDFQTEINKMNNIVDNMTAHMQHVRERFETLRNAPISLLKEFDAAKLKAAVDFNKAEFEENKKEFSAAADKITAGTEVLMEKIDESEKLHDEIAEKFQFLLMEQPQFMERHRVGFFGGGVAVAQEDNKSRFYPKRAAAMMRAIQGFETGLQSDLKNKALIEAFANTPAGWNLLRTQATIDFYDIAESFRNIGKGFYKSDKLKEIVKKLDKFITQNNLDAAYHLKSYVPGQANDAAAVYAALATSPKYPEGDLHLYNAGDRKDFEPKSDKSQEEKTVEMEPVKKVHWRIVEEVLSPKPAKIKARKNGWVNEEKKQVKEKWQEEKTNDSPKEKPSVFINRRKFS